MLKQTDNARTAYCLTMRALCAGYDRNALVLKNLDARFSESDVHYVVGASGCGKTTLMLVLAGVLKSFSGTLQRTPDARPKLVLQFPEQLFLADTIEEELALFGDDSLGDAARNNLEVLGLDMNDKSARTSRSLSFAERRLLALAIQSAGAAPFLLLDEPTLGLDEENLRRIVKWLSAQLRTNVLCVVVTHDADLLSLLPGRLHLLESGAIVWSGDSGEFLRDERLRSRAGFTV